MKTQTRLSLVTGLLFTLILCGSLSAQTPMFGPSMPINSIFSIAKDDDIVVITGKVVRQVKEDEFLVRDNTGQVLVDVERERHFGVAIGQTITLRGKVDWEPFSAKEVKAIDVQVLENPSQQGTNPAARADVVSIQTVNTRSKDGEIVTVAGRIVRRVDSDEFMLRDESGEIKVDADFKRFHNMPLSVGQSIIVTGEVDLHWLDSGKDIEAQSIQIQQLPPPPPPQAPTEYVVLPIRDIHERGQNGDLVTFTARLENQIDVDEFLFKDDTASIVVNVDPQHFSQIPLSAGKSYTVTGSIKKTFDDQAEIEARIITQMLESHPPSAPGSSPEIPISSVYYDCSHGQVVTIAGTIIRHLPPDDLVVQDDTGAIVADLPAEKFKTLDLSVGKFVIIHGAVDKKPDGRDEIDASQILVRGRPE